MKQQGSKNIYTIGAGEHFSRIIAEKLVHEYKDNKHALTDVTILLPTRRACRNFQNSFLQITKGQPLLLPKIQPLGDVDEQDLSLSLAGTKMLDRILELPAAMSPLRRRILLAKAIYAINDYTSGFDKAIGLADALAGFMDQIIIEGLELSALEHIVPEEFSDHWQITLDFLKILGENWPSILAEEGAIDAVDRRNKLMHIQAEFWAETQPSAPIIAAGSTGSIPATANLLSVISQLPNGKVILPGLDGDMDDESWDNLDESHPQFGLKHLLGELGVNRNNVHKYNDPAEEQSSRARLAGEIMRPSETSQNWQKAYKNNPQDLHNALINVCFFEAENRREEATAIALKFREILESTSKTAALITPDRKLARQVSAVCKRWGIDVDDSAGMNLNVTPVGIFALLLCEAAEQNLSPKSFLALLKHKFCHAGMKQSAYMKALYDLEKYVLRGVKPNPGFNGMKERIALLATNEHAPDMSHILGLLEVIEPQMRPFIELMHAESTFFFKDFLKVHLETMEMLASTVNHAGEDILWIDEDGEALAKLCAELWEHADAFEPLNGPGYTRILSHLMGTISVRPSYGMHPRLSILGQLEARMVDADLLILSGLNEGLWPPDPGHDPWMSRPMRKEFGLPGPERSIGLAAHDFVQGFCNENVLLTRSKEIDGTRQVPARWLARLDTILKTYDLSLDSLQDHNISAWIRKLDAAGQPKPVERPMPKPPKQKRPAKMSVTKIETWMKDPYSIYASEILKLRKLEALEKPIEAKEKGTILHGILEKFIARYPEKLPQDSIQILHDIAKKELETFAQDDSEWSFWWPRFNKMAGWFIQNETSWRQTNRVLSLEAKGEAAIQTDKTTFTLKGIADRIDLDGDGACAIIDYKTSTGFSAAKMASGESPQLSLEAILLMNDAFAGKGIQAKKMSYLGYWCMTGGTEVAKIFCLPNQKNPDLGAIIANTENGLKNLIDSFYNDDIPYICLPKSHQIPRFNDYEHLARIAEWAALDDNEQEAA